MVWSVSLINRLDSGAVNLTLTTPGYSGPRRMFVGHRVSEAPESSYLVLRWIDGGLGYELGTLSQAGGNHCHWVWVTTNFRPDS